MVGVKPLSGVSIITILDSGKILMSLLGFGYISEWVASAICWSSSGVPLLFDDVGTSVTMSFASFVTFSLLSLGTPLQQAVVFPQFPALLLSARACVLT